MTFDDLANMVRAKTVSTEAAFCLLAMMHHPDMDTKARVAGFLGCSKITVQRLWRELKGSGLLEGIKSESPESEVNPNVVSLVGYLPRSKKEPTKGQGESEMNPQSDLTPDELVMLDYYAKHLAPLGVQRAARESLLRWTQERHMDAAVIMEAIDVTAKANCYGSKLGYLDGVLRNWYARGWNAYELWQEGMEKGRTAVR
jgi:DnaD/phage-associated family protein